MDRLRTSGTSGSLNETTGPRRSKVERLLEEYDLEDLGRELEDRWTGRTTEQQSLRELADFFNRRLLESELRDSGSTPFDGEVENVYDLLTDDEVSEGIRTQTRMRLEGSGVSVDDLREDFVSHQAVHTYLTDRRNVEYRSESESPDEGSVETEIEKIQRLQGRTTAVIEDTVERMRKSDLVEVGDFDVLVNARILCKNCGTAHNLTDFLEEGGCHNE